MRQYYYAIVAFVLFIIITITVAGLIKYNPDYIHYKGKSEVTRDQLYELSIIPRDDDGIMEDINVFDYYFQVENDKILFTYDFYSPKTFTYLENDGRVDNFLRNPAYVNVVDGIKKEWEEDKWESIKNIIILLCIIVLGVIIINWLAVSNGLVHFIAKMDNYLIKQVDKKLLEVDKYELISDISQFKMQVNNGIMCVRSWTIDKKGTLKSLVMDNKWESKEIFADINPKKGNINGIHAYIVGSPVVQKSSIMGIVEMSGKYTYHPDGVIRSEYCRILVLFVNKTTQKTGKLLSNKYSVPVYLCDSALNGYIEWLHTENGIRSIKHNEQTIGGI